MIKELEGGEVKKEIFWNVKEFGKVIEILRFI